MINNICNSPCTHKNGNDLLFIVEGAKFIATVFINSNSAIHSGAVGRARGYYLQDH
jgi:hypothetical protein